MPEDKPLQKSKRTISEKSTKHELWNAYDELLAQTAKEPVTVDLKQKEFSVPDAFKQLSDLKLKISQQLDSTGEQLLQDLNNLMETRNLIIKEKRNLV